MKKLEGSSSRSSSTMVKKRAMRSASPDDGSAKSKGLFGRQKGHRSLYRGRRVWIDFLPKINVEVVLDDAIGRGGEAIQERRPAYGEDRRRQILVLVRRTGDRNRYRREGPTRCGCGVLERAATIRGGAFMSSGRGRYSLGRLPRVMKSLRGPFRGLSKSNGNWPILWSCRKSNPVTDWQYENVQLCAASGYSPHHFENRKRTRGYWLRRRGRVIGGVFRSQKDALVRMFEVAGEEIAPRVRLPPRPNPDPSGISARKKGDGAARRGSCSYHQIAHHPFLRCYLWSGPRFLLRKIIG